MAEVKLKFKRLAPNKLEPYGFKKNGNGYTYTTDILDGAFRMEVKISADGKIETHLFDTGSEEEYVLHLVPSSVGEFVGSVREAYEKVIDDIAAKCYETEIFKSKQTHEILSYAHERYGTEPEYLWEKFPDNAVLRRADNQKWYAAILTVKKSKLGIKSDETAEVVDLRIQPENMGKLIDNEKYFPGWHMNKKHWYTICLEGTVPTEEIFERIDASYELAMK